MSQKSSIIRVRFFRNLYMPNRNQMRKNEGSVDNSSKSPFYQQYQSSMKASFSEYNKNIKIQELLICPEVQGLKNWEQIQKQEYQRNQGNYHQYIAIIAPSLSNPVLYNTSTQINVIFNDQCIGYVCFGFVASYLPIKDTIIAIADFYSFKLPTKFKIEIVKSKNCRNIVKFESLMGKSVEDIDCLCYIINIPKYGWENSSIYSFPQINDRSDSLSLEKEKLIYDTLQCQSPLPHVNLSTQTNKLGVDSWCGGKWKSSPISSKVSEFNPEKHLKKTSGVCEDKHYRIWSEKTDEQIKLLKLKSLQCMNEPLLPIPNQSQDMVREKLEQIQMQISMNMNKSEQLDCRYANSSSSKLDFIQK